MSVLEHVKLWCRVRHASPDNEGSLAGCLLYAPVITYLQTVLLLFNIAWIRKAENIVAFLLWDGLSHNRGGRL